MCNFIDINFTAIILFIYKNITTLYKLRFTQALGVNLRQFYI